MTPEQVKSIVGDHDTHWQKQRPLLRRLDMTYACKPLPEDASDHVVQSTRGFEYVEGYVASLFSKAPAVVLSPDIRGRGNTEVAEPLANLWLTAQHAELTEATRIAFVYPGSYLKLSPRLSSDPYLRVTAQPVMPWDVIIDRMAPCWDKMRYAIHRYWMPLEAAQERYGQGDKWKGTGCSAFLDSVVSTDGDNDPHVEIYEVFDLSADRFYVWSPQFSDGLSWARDGIVVQQGGSPLEGASEDTKEVRFKNIPFRTSDNEPLLPILRLSYGNRPGSPLEAIAPLSRVLDLAYEHAVVRTFQAGAVRKAARQWLLRKGTLDTDALASLVAGLDGTYVEVDADPAIAMSGVIFPVPHTQVPPETYTYVNALDADFQRGSITAPFTRGEATKATATEVVALAAYSASEIGRMARVRDTLVEGTALAYLSMVRVYLGDKDDADLILSQGKLIAVRPEDLDADFQASALDQGSTPLGDAAKKNELVGLAPTLMQLGVPASSILSELVRRYDLPADWAIAPPATVTQPTPGQASRAASSIEEAEEPILPGQSIPSEQIQRVLPTTG